MSTKLSLNFNKTLEIYQLRWSIKVFFKESKQLLNPGKSQSNDFDAQIADTTIAMVQYIFFALHKRVEKYENRGAIYKGTKEEVLKVKLHDRLILLLIAVLELIQDLFEDADSDELFVKIINDERVFERIKFLIRPAQNKLEKLA